MILNKHLCSDRMVSSLGSNSVLATDPYFLLACLLWLLNFFAYAPSNLPLAKPHISRHILSGISFLSTRNKLITVRNICILQSAFPVSFPHNRWVGSLHTLLRSPKLRTHIRSAIQAHHLSNSIIFSAFKFILQVYLPAFIASYPMHILVISYVPRFPPLFLHVPRILQTLKPVD